MAKKHEHTYPDRILNRMGTLQEALSDNYHDGEVVVEGYYDFLPKSITVEKRPLIGSSHIIDGFTVSDADGNVVWRVGWAPFYPDNFKIQLATGTETRNVWHWRKLRRVPTEFYTFETIRPYDQYAGWDAIEDVLADALDSYHEWKAGKLAVAS